MGALIWLFGRGCSIACGLPWTLPAAWAGRPRQELIAAIRGTLRDEMNAPAVDTKPYVQLLTVLAQANSPNWRHRFVTTNSDSLLQRVVDKAYPTVCPEWLEWEGSFARRGFAVGRRQPVASALDGVRANLEFKLPGASVVPVRRGFADWVADGLPELRENGMLKSQCQ